MKTIYLAGYSYAEFYDEQDEYIYVFVSEDKEKVERWVEKFNTILHRWRAYYEERTDRLDWGLRKNAETLHSRLNRTRQTGEAFIDEIELR